MICLKCLRPITPLKSAHYGLHPSCFTEWFNLPSTTEFESLKNKSDTIEDADFSPQNSSFFHGKFKKYAASLRTNSYILKMRQDEAPELPEVEYLCNQIAETLDIPVAKFYFISFYGDQTFVTRNFIKHGTPIDLRHIYHFRSDDQHSCEGLIRVIKEKTHRPHDVRIFIRTLLFDALIGNHDRHGRNLAFIATARRISLSPIYDNVSYLSLESGNMLKADFNPTGRISTKETFEPGMVDYVKELKRLGYEEEVQGFYKNIKLSQISELIKKSFCSELMKSALKRLIEKRFKELKDELST